MRVDVITLFPGMFQGPMSESILKRAQAEGKIAIHFHDLREFGIGSYHQIDDAPYGGGAGMVMMCEPIVQAIEKVSALQDGAPYRVYLSPRGEPLMQHRVEKIAATQKWLLLLCGHYEGIDQRIIDGGWIDTEISIGDYVLTGGELPAMVLIDAVARQIPGVLGKEESAEEESFSPALDRKREYPHYTRPEEFRGLSVPDVLLSGNHAEIEQWRRSHLLP